MNDGFTHWKGSSYGRKPEMQAPMQKVGQQGGGESVKGFPHWISEGVSGKHKGTDTDHRTQSLQQSHGNGLLPTGGGGNRLVPRGPTRLSGNS